MRKILIRLFTLLLALMPIAVISHSSKEIAVEAVYYFTNKDYKKAYDLYDKLNAKNPKELDYKFRLGYCCLYYPEKKKRAIEIFEEIKKGKKTKDIDYYLGKAYHVNYRFQDAVKELDAYIASVTKPKEEDKIFIEDAKQIIKYCQNGIELIDKKVQADITNLGTTIKTNDSLWSEPSPINSLNTNGNDAAIALSADGTKLFTYISNNDEGDIYMSILNGNKWSHPEKLNKNINTEAWEGSCSMSADGRFLYFASERKGGMGGRDIYISEFQNGEWGPAKNMGSRINTPLDDDAPFIHPDGITLFFSSKGHSSIGGYDIMFAVQKDGEWLEPRNMGIPLNTTEDDRYYVINAKGDKGFFSSDRGV